MKSHTSKPFDFQVHHFSEVSSTSALVRQHADNGAEEGLVIATDHQTEGRGKPGRKWISPPGENLLFSLLLRPAFAVHQAPLLTQIACRSVATVLKNVYAIDSTFKNPNDVMVKDKKICGILIETVSNTNQKLESVIVGIGLNVNSKSEDLIAGAISMKEILGKEIDREKVLTHILDQLGKDFQSFYATAA